MAMLSNLQIQYTCKVNKSGYEAYQKLDSEGISRETWIEPIHKKAGEKAVEFTHEIFLEFFRIFETYRYHELQEEVALDFYRKYGPLYGFQRERLQDFIGLVDLININEQKRKEGELPSSDNFFPEITFEHADDGTIVPTFQPTSLQGAIMCAWAFHWERPKMEECLYKKEYGLRKGCEKFFEVRDSKKFCSDACRAGYYMKKGRGRTK